MANIKVVISDPKTGRTGQLEVNEDATKRIQGLKVGDTFKGEIIEFTGYEFEITGGSDFAGFPLRADLPGSGRKKILTKSNVIGVKKRDRKGVRVRKTVCAATIDTKTTQVNTKIIKAGKAPIEFLQEKKEEPKEAAADGQAKTD